MIEYAMFAEGRTSDDIFAFVVASISQSITNSSLRHLAIHFPELFCLSIKNIKGL